MPNVIFPTVSQALQTNMNKEATKAVTPYAAQQNFASYLKQSIENVNELQLQSDVMTEKLARGENVDLHQVMISAQKASVSLQATMEIRNKVIEAYQEVMRMQV